MRIYIFLVWFVEKFLLIPIKIQGDQLRAYRLAERVNFSMLFSQKQVANSSPKNAALNPSPTINKPQLSNEIK